MFPFPKRHIKLGTVRKRRIALRKNPESAFYALLSILLWVACLRTLCIPLVTAQSFATTACRNEKIAIFGGNQGDTGNSACSDFCDRDDSDLRFCVLYPTSTACEVNGTAVGSCTSKNISIKGCRHFSCYYVETVSPILQILPAQSSDTAGSSTNLDVEFLGPMNLGPGVSELSIVGTGSTIQVEPTALRDTQLTAVVFKNSPIDQFSFDFLPTTIEKLEIIDCGMTALPEPSDTLSISSLNLSRNELTAFPSQVTSFPELAALNLSGNVVMQASMTLPTFEYILNRSRDNSFFELDLSNTAFQAEITECDGDIRILPGDYSVCVLGGSSGKETPLPTDPMLPMPTDKPSTDDSNALEDSVDITFIILLICLLCGAIVAAFGIRYIVQKRKFQSALSSNLLSGSDQSSMSSDQEPNCFYIPEMKSQYSPNQFPELLDLRIDTSQLSSIVGDSLFVCHAMYRDEPVLMKEVIADNDTPKDEIDIVAESVLLMSRLTHPNIVRFVGVSWTPNSMHLTVLTDFDRDAMSLNAYLVQKRKANERLDTTLVVQMGLDIVSSLCFMHEMDFGQHGLTHKNLTSYAVQVYSDATCRVMVYSSCYSAVEALRNPSRTRIQDRQEYGSHKLPWMAPEILRGEKARPESDLYSFGTLLYQMLTLKTPYENIIQEYGQTVGELMIQEKVLSSKFEWFGDGIQDEELGGIVASCTHPEGAQRPSAKVVARQLRSIQDFRSSIFV